LLCVHNIAPFWFEFLVTLNLKYSKHVCIANIKLENSRKFSLIYIFSLKTQENLAFSAFLRGV